MDMKILTHEGFIIDVSTGAMDTESFASQLNDRNLLTLPLAGMVLIKNMFKTILPDGELTGAYELHTADGNVYLTDIADFDEKVISDKFNSSQNEFFLVGNIIIQRHNFKMIKLASV